MLRKPSVDSGDGGISSSGENANNQINNIQTYVASSKKTFIRKSALFEVSKKIIDSDLSDDSDFDTSSVAEWDVKIDYNDLSTQYKEILKSEAEHYQLMTDIMAEFPNGEKLIKKIRRIYLKKDKQHNSADEILESLYSTLELLLIQAEESTNEVASFLDEDREKCVWLIIFYVFTKCQILKLPPENKK